MIFFNLFVKLIFSIVQLFADGAAREAPQRRVAAHLMLIRYELDRIQRLLRRPLVIMNDFFLVLRSGTRRLGTEADFTLIDNGRSFGLTGVYLWSYRGDIVC